MGNIPRPLEGIKVVELSTFIAAPSCARFLADLGAEVIKIESPKGDPLRYTAVNEGRPMDHKEDTTYDLENAGKRCITLDTKTEAGRAVLEKLISQADVFVTNWRQPALKRANLDYETLHEKYHSLVFAFVSGYGEKGPDKDLPGFDYTAFYARTGIIGALHDRDSLPMLTIPGFGDHQVGMNLSAGILAALLRAKMTGEGDRVVVSLFHTGIWIQSLMIQASQYGKASTQYPISVKELTNPLNNAIKTKDGSYIQIAMPAYDRYYPIFMKAMGHEELMEDPRFYPQTNLVKNLDEFYEFLIATIGSFTMEEMKKRMDDADLPYSECQTWDKVLVDKQAWASDCFYEMEYPNGAKRTMVRTPVMFEESGLPPYKRGPYLGENTEEILAELGYSADEIAALIESGAAFTLNDEYKD